MFTEITATYVKHGWKLASVLAKPQTRAELESAGLLTSVQVKESVFDALWFSRPSHENREAWEIRFLAEHQYALFETFEADETEDERAEARAEMEARLREKLLSGH